MNYGDPKLRAILAGEYVLGTLPARARARFERLMRYDAGLVRLVGDWAERLGAMDAALRPQTPPPAVWRAIERRTLSPSDARRQIRRTARWRMVGWVPVAILLAVVFNVFSRAPAPVQVPAAPQAKPEIVAVLSDTYGKPGWIVTFDRPHASFDVTALRTVSGDDQHSYELWVMEDDKPLPLGVIATSPAQTVAVRASEVPRAGQVFAVSLEPAGGSPTGLPTGPVVYRGPILQD